MGKKEVQACGEINHKTLKKKETKKVGLIISMTLKKIKISNLDVKT